MKLRNGKGLGAVFLFCVAMQNTAHAYNDPECASFYGPSISRTLLNHGLTQVQVDYLPAQIKDLLGDLLEKHPGITEIGALAPQQTVRGKAERLASPLDLLIPRLRLPRQSPLSWISRSKAVYVIQYFDFLVTHADSLAELADGLRIAPDLDSAVALARNISEQVWAMGQVEYLPAEAERLYEVTLQFTNEEMGDFYYYNHTAVKIGVTLRGQNAFFKLADALQNFRRMNLASQSRAEWADELELLVNIDYLKNDVSPQERMFLALMPDPKKSAERRLEEYAKYKSLFSEKFTNFSFTENYLPVAQFYWLTNALEVPAALVPFLVGEVARPGEVIDATNFNAAFRALNLISQFSLPEHGVKPPRSPLKGEALVREIFDSGRYDTEFYKEVARTNRGGLLPIWAYRNEKNFYPFRNILFLGRPSVCLD